VETLTGPAAARATTITTRSEEETRAFAAALATVARAGDRIALVGSLGAGKTQFAKGFASGLGVREVVNSPSFTLMAEYAGRLALFHQDLYRLAGADEILAGGLLDERQSEGVTLSEWAERLPATLDPDRLTVHIDIAGENDRRISVEPVLADHDRYATAAQAWRP
jgi:tRNA threonylcarbamoyladenosine biosynthesis protein TsaE